VQQLYSLKLNSNNKIVYTKHSASLIHNASCTVHYSSTDKYKSQSSIEQVSRKSSLQYTILTQI